MKKERGGATADGSDTQPIPIVPAYQEGSVQSVGSGPSGRDDSDRSGDGTLDPAASDAEAGPAPARDAFVSSEVSDKATTPGKDSRTRS